MKFTKCCDQSLLVSSLGLLFIHTLNKQSSVPMELCSILHANSTGADIDSERLSNLPRSPGCPGLPGWGGFLIPCPSIKMELPLFLYQALITA